MTAPVYYGSLVAISIAAPILASCFRSIRWRYKLPLCLLLANILPFLAITPSFPTPGAAGGFAIAMMFGLVISTLIVLPLSMFMKDRASQ
ncbi:MAG TPA: hypothetical protein VI168_17230 [Croceibacterium sp.]